MRALEIVAIAIAVLLLIAVSLALDYAWKLACFNIIAPIFVGDDAVALAIFCK